MTRSTVSCCHSLRIIPLSNLVKFARIKSRVVMSLLGGDDAMAVPGSVKVSASTEDDIIKKQIVFERSDVSSMSAEQLDRYKALRLIATYVDESGNPRVAGSPDCPLSLDYSDADGVFTVTLKGEDSFPDAFIEA